MMISSYVVTEAGRGVGRAVTERLLSRGGRVVAIDLDDSSLGWAAGHPAADQIADGIRVNAVALGTIAVERYVNDVERFGAEGPEWASQTARLHALERVGAPAEAASAIVYLLSEDASFITGTVLPVDGGRSALAREPAPPERP